MLKLLDAIGRFQLAQAVAQWAWAFVPAGWAVLTGGAGILGGLPLMWVMVAAAASAAFGSFAFMTFSMQSERKNPLNKLQIQATIFQHDLAPIVEPNRQMRKGMEKERVVVPARTRSVSKGQLGVQIFNSASFPMSVMLAFADTQIEGKKPPRSTLPKRPTIIQPGGTFWIHDETIDLGGLPCVFLRGMIDLKIMYGRPSKEKFEMIHTGAVEIFMEPSGFLKQVYFHPVTAMI